jgi:hypothetical protein
MRQFLCTAMVMCFLTSEAIGQCSGTGRIIGEEVQCCDRDQMVHTTACQGFTGMCDPFNSMIPCGHNCFVQEAGCGGSDATSAKTSSAKLSDVARSNGRFSESACGAGFNSWLDGKLAMKVAAQPRLPVGQ